MKKKIIGIGLMVAVVLIFFSNFRVSIFNYKNNLTDLKGNSYCVYEDKTGYKVLEASKHNFIIRVISWNDYRNN